MQSLKLVLTNLVILFQAQAQKRYQGEEANSHDKTETKKNKKNPSTPPPPKLPPPGGDVPAYMLKDIFSQQNKRVIVASQQDKLEEDSSEYDDYEPETSQIPKQRNVPNKAPSDNNPLSKLISPLRDILPRNWFHEDNEQAMEEEFQHPQMKQGRQRPQNPKPPQNLPPPVFNPPGNFPTFRKDKRNNNKNNGRFPPPSFHTQFQGPNNKNFLAQQKFGLGPKSEHQFHNRGPSYRAQKGPKVELWCQ